MPSSGISAQFIGKAFWFVPKKAFMLFKQPDPLQAIGRPCPHASVSRSKVEMLDEADVVVIIGGLRLGNHAHLVGADSAITTT